MTDEFTFEDKKYKVENYKAIEVKEETLSDCLRCNGGTNKEHIRDVKQKLADFDKELSDKLDGICMAHDNEDDIRLRNVIKELIDKAKLKHFGRDLVKPTKKWGRTY